MSRVAVRLGLICLAPFVMAGAASAQESCRGAVVSAPYKEQVCQRGAGGYSECRWIDRVYMVPTATDCTASASSKRAVPAQRAYPARRPANRG